MSAFPVLSEKTGGLCSWSPGPCIILAPSTLVITPSLQPVQLTKLGCMLKLSGEPMPHLTPMLSGSLGWGQGWIHFKSPQVPFKKHKFEWRPTLCWSCLLPLLTEVSPHNPLQVGNKEYFSSSCHLSSLQLYIYLHQLFDEFLTI